MILIVTQRDDKHTDAVAKVLERKRARYLCLETADFPHQMNISVSFSSASSRAVLRVDNRNFDLSTVRTIWYRRPRAPGALLETSTAAAARSNYGDVIEGLWYYLDTSFWVNSYYKYRSARFKPYQIYVARAVGLDTPHTLITNDPAQVMPFLESCSSGMIYKPFSAYCTADDRGIYSSVVDVAKLTAYHPGIALAPCIFQEYVQKRADLRVTVIGDQVFTVEIVPQRNDVSPSIDWRRSISSMLYRPFEVRSDVRHKIQELMSHLGLVFGCVDLIHTPDDRYVFLEINPAGQWLWAELVTGLPLLHHFTEMLIQGTPSYQTALKPL